MSKRSASSDLNHENWDRDEEPEEAGEFSKASDDVIKKRVMKVAKRRNLVAMAKNEESGPGVFAAFSFAKTSTAPSTTFGFLSNLSNKETKTNGITSTTNSETPTADEYYAKLKGLNESVLSWISKKVNENPLINLQPVFKDYEKYFEELEKNRPKSDQSSTNNPKTANAENKSLPTFNMGTTPTFNFGSSSLKFTSSTDSNAQGTNTVDKTNAFPSFNFGNAENKSDAKFSFGSTDTGTAAKPSEKYSFGSSLISTQSSPKFSFGSTTTNSATTVEKTSEETNDDEEEPPKNEFTPVVEKDYIYTIRCKLFVKKNESYSDRGVGNLYLKKVSNSEKVQLIVRADTSLGNLLCNFILSESIPMRKMGKRDVMLVCLPTPETKPPPVPILLRVKSSEDADELLKTLEKYKK